VRFRPTSNEFDEQAESPVMFSHHLLSYVNVFLPDIRAGLIQFCTVDNDVRTSAIKKQRNQTKEEKR